MSLSIVVLLSGNGSNLQAIIDACDDGQIKGEVSAVISNRPDAFGLTRASRANIPCHTVEHKDYPRRESFDRALIKHIDSHQPDIVILAGFMRIFSPLFVQHYANRLLNIHPSLLPKHKGLDTHQRVLDAGDKEHGCSVHFVTETLDDGPIIAQSSVPVDATDTVDDLKKKVQQQEHRLYPIVLEWIASNRLQHDEHGHLLDQQRLPSSGYQLPRPY